MILELVEEIEPTMLHSSRKKKPINRKEYDRRCDFVVDSLSSFFSVNLPVEGPQEFQTDLGTTAPIAALYSRRMLVTDLDSRCLQSKSIGCCGSSFSWRHERSVIAKL